MNIILTYNITILKCVCVCYHIYFTPHLEHFEVFDPTIFTFYNNFVIRKQFFFVHKKKLLTLTYVCVF